METLQRLHNRGSVSTGYDIDYSYKNENDNAEKMTHTYDSAPTSQKKGTMSLWFKRTEVGSNIGVFQFGDDASGDYLAVRWGRDIYGSGETYRMRIGGSTNITLDGDGAVRDTAAWYHMVIAIDTTQATASNRFRVYRNGEEVSMSTDNRSSLTQNTDMAIGENGKDIMIGEGVYKYNGFIAEVNYVDGQQLTPSDFGEYDSDSGIWIPKKYTGTYGNNGFYLDFSNASNLGEDQSGNNHDFTLSNITSANQATDTPTNNFATINTLQANYSNLIISNGATDIVKSGNHGWQTTTANIAVKEGKWYAEFKLDTSASLIMLGVNQIEDEAAWNGSHIGAYTNSTARGMGYYSSNGYFYRNGGSGAIGSTYTAGDIISIALRINADGTGFMGMAKNGTWQNSQDPSSGTTGMLGLEYGNPIESGIHYTFAISTHESAGGVLANFGGFPGFTISSGNSDANGYGNFEYTVPTGYYALCTKNLEEFG